MLSALSSASRGRVDHDHVGYQRFMASTAASFLTNDNFTRTRQAMRAVAGLLLALYLIALAALFHIAWQQDTDAAEQSRFYAGKAFLAERKTLLTTIGDYAFWGEAYRNLHVKVDLDWAFVRENMGPSLFRDYGFEGLFVVGPTDSTSYAVINGQLEEMQADQWLRQDLTAILNQARVLAEDGEAATQFILINDQPALLASAALTTGGDFSEPVIPGTPSVVLFVNLLTPGKLHELGDAFGLDDLRTAETDVDDAQALTLAAHDGRSFTITWDTPTPGRDLLMVMLPLMALLGLVLAVIAHFTLRKATRAAREIDASYRSLAEAKTALTNSEARFRDVAEASSDWIWETDAQLRLTYLSERFHEVTGHLPADWLGQPICAFLKHTEDLRGVLQNETLSFAESSSIQCIYLDKTGRERICRLSLRRIVNPVLGTVGRTIGFRGTASDVTDEMEARARIEHLSQHDALTGLPNRNRLRAFLDGKLQAITHEDTSLVMMSLDLDRFKPVNDTYGHEAGDWVLNEVAARMRECLRGDDLVARMGGDEFVLILTNLESTDEIERLCERLIATIEKPFCYGNHRIYISASIGLSLAPADSTNAEDLLRNADLALYEAKNVGRNTWCFYAADMNARLIDRRRTEDYLSRTIKEQNLSMVMQPRYCLDSGDVVGAEALVRWVHPEKGLLLPKDFIRIAEKTGDIIALSNWVLHRACSEANSWNVAHRVSVNLSPVEFQRGELVSRVRNVLKETGLAPERLELELTEAVLLEDPEHALKTMRELRLLGVQLCLDDYGTGYSSLSSLRRFPFSGLKIDTTLVKELGDAESNQAMFSSIVQLGKALSLEVTAEGVEDDVQLQLVKSLGCDTAQGYFLGHPIVPARLWDTLETQDRYNSLKGEA